MDHMEKLVKKHNNNFEEERQKNRIEQNCRENNTCPLDGKCLSSNIFTGNNQLPTINNQSSYWQQSTRRQIFWYLQNRIQNQIR